MPYSKTLAAIAKKDRRVDSYQYEPDNKEFGQHWLHLKNGFTIDGFPSIHEKGVKDCIHQLANVRSEAPKACNEVQEVVRLASLLGHEWIAVELRNGEWMSFYRSDDFERVKKAAEIVALQWPARIYRRKEDGKYELHSRYGASVK